MPFSFDIHAKPVAVGAMLETDERCKGTPEAVKDFIRAACASLEHGAVRVQASGHLSTEAADGAQLSSCRIDITPIKL